MKKSCHITEMIGKRYGRLVVISFVGITKTKNADRIRNHYRFNCVCDCGNTKEIDGVPLRNGSTLSCGCYRKERVLVGHDKQRGKARPHVQKADRISLCNGMFLSYKSGAIKREIEFSLSKDEFIELTSQNCSYCLAEPRIYRKRDSFVIRAMNGIDRVDSSIGYIKSNCVPCCKTCNYMKHELSIEEWIKHMKKVLQTLEG